MKGFGRKYPIALESDGKDFFAVQLKGTNKNISIRSALSYRLPVDSDPEGAGQSENFLKVLKALKQSNAFSGNRAVIHIPMENILCFPVDIMVKEDDNIEEAIVNEALKSLPYTLEEAVIDYLSVYSSEDPRHRTAIITAAKRKYVMDHLALYQQAGFQVEAVDFSPISLLRLHNFLIPMEQEPDIICHIGMRQSYLMVVSANRVYALSKFSWGKVDLVKRLNNIIDIGNIDQAAKRLLNTYGISGIADNKEDRDIARVISRVLTPAIEGLVFEFHKVLGYARSKEKFHTVANIYFYGLAKEIKGLIPFLEQRLNINTIQGNIESKISLSDSFSQGTLERTTLFRPVVGLAMRKLPWL
jgi:Tfp pilus assembly PilM family ATPase